MKKVLQVLSVDYDLFQIVTVDTIEKHYPDGIDLTDELSKVVWRSHYSEPDGLEDLLNVKTDRHLLSELYGLLSASFYYKLSDVMICNSHKHIYPFIREHYDRGDFEKVYIDHLDMHHDMFNGNDALDCGNWLEHIKKEIPTRINWVTNPISRKVYGLTKPEFDSIRTDFSNLTDRVWDIIFLCKSSNWVPPHLDEDFCDLAKFLVLHGGTVNYEPDIMQSRWTKGYLEDIKALQEEVKMLKEKMNR